MLSDLRPRRAWRKYGTMRAKRCSRLGMGVRHWQARGAAPGLTDYPARWRAAWQGVAAARHGGAGRRFGALAQARRHRPCAVAPRDKAGGTPRAVGPWRSSVERGLSAKLQQIHAANETTGNFAHFIQQWAPAGECTQASARRDNMRPSQTGAESTWQQPAYLPMKPSGFAL